MGNCIVLQRNVIKILKLDGEILQYKAPLKVQQVLSEHVGHAISDNLPVIHHLRPDSEMIGGREYYLLPQPEIPMKRAIAFSKPDADAGQGTGVVRIKLVISKKELQAMLEKGGVSVGDMIPEFQNEELTNGADEKLTSIGWKPTLESIPEGD